MSERRTGHEHLRDLYKNSGSREQSAVRVAGSTRTRDSTKTGSKKSKKSLSGKSPKRSDRNKPSTTTSKHSGSMRKKGAGKDSPASSQRKKSTQSKRSGGRATSSTKTATTPPSKARTPGARSSPSTSPLHKNLNGQDIQEKTEFENDGAGLTTAGGGMAEAKIKERKLQWKTDEMTTSPISATHTNMETSPGSHDEPYGSVPKKEEKPLKPLEADKTVKERTIFENDVCPAAVKEPERQLQWAPGANKGAAADKAVSCYIAPTMQHSDSYNSELVKIKEDDKKK